jgi:hypothetical protein
MVCPAAASSVNTIHSQPVSGMQRFQCMFD